MGLIVGSLRIGKPVFWCGKGDVATLSAKIKGGTGGR